MSLYKELLPYMEYLRSFRKLKNYLSFDMVFPTKWIIPKNLIEDGSTVEFATDDQLLKGISFVCPNDGKNVQETLLVISKLIKINKEKELKEELFKKSVDNLKKIFEKTDIDKLKNLTINFEEDITTLNIDESDGFGSEPEDVELAGKGENEG
jgi:hypothetical protein